MTEPCSRSWEIDPYRDGRLGKADARSFERHLRICETCRAVWSRDEPLRALARALPNEEPTELELRRLRARVLRDAATGVTAPMASPRLHKGLASLTLVAALALGAAGAWALIARHAPQAVDATPATTTATSATGPAPSAQAAEALAGAVVAADDARWSQSRARGVERVVLEDGVIRLHVRPQLVGERFVVTVPDGEIEVRGTTFDVSVQHAATTRVHVDEGIVEVRLRGRDVQRLEAGQTWSAERPPVNPPSGPPHAARPPTTASAATDAGPAYATAIGLLRDGRNDEAAAAFHALVVSQPGGAQAEDASFLEAVALARAGRGDAAALAAEHHLAAFPASFHHKEAAILVARAARQRGDCGKARAVLAPWTGQGQDGDVQSTLRGCEGR